MSGAIAGSFGPAQAACLFAPTAGDDTYICDSGTSIGGLTDLAGNNKLTLPAGSTGNIIAGNVTFGPGTDVIDMQSGMISGAVDQGLGADQFIIGGGTVTGNVQQGGGIDDFRMTGGQIGSLNQGDALDTFFMSGGRIVDAFEDGDYGVMTGGRIGRVNMKLDNNYFNMSGGAIDNNLVTGFGNDTIILSNGTIGGNISVSGGTDSVTVTGGSVGGEVRMSTGTDTFTWDGGGVISGLIDLGGDNDTAILRNLTDANIGATPQITGGAGTDSLTFDNVRTTGVARFDSWETVALTNNTQLIFDGTLTLGDAATGTGSLTIDPASTAYGGGTNGAVSAFAAGQLVNVVNGGRIDLTNRGDGASDAFTIHGNYIGNGGQLLLNTVLGDDSSPSDRLIIDRGAVSGTTGIGIVNVGGGGATTLQDGIMVVEATNGGTTASGAFELDGRVAAGAHEYYLFKGGTSAVAQDNWYLRSTLVTPPTSPPPITVPGDGGFLSTEEATPVIADVVPLYRIEVPTYSAIPPVAHHLALSTLGTFHERRGEQSLLIGSGYLPASWGRVFGQDADMKWSGTVAPSLDGHLFGMQAGQDVFGWNSNNDAINRVGFFVGSAFMDGDIRGEALGWNNLAVGGIDASGTSFGGYWTHIEPGGGYLDGILMGTWFGGNATSKAGQHIDAGGSALTASLEGGYPIALGSGWTLEPQGQIIWNHLSLSDEADDFSPVSFDSDDAVTGRVGMRLQGSYDAGGTILQPYFKANLWHNFDADQTVSFDTDRITTTIGGTSLEVGGGVVAKVSESTSLFATADYTTNLGGDKTRIWEGNLGISVRW